MLEVTLLEAMLVRIRYIKENTVTAFSIDNEDDLAVHIKKIDYLSDLEALVRRIPEDCAMILVE